MPEERDLLEQIALLEAYLLSGPDCLLIVATSNSQTEKGICEELKLRIKNEVSIETFTYNSNSIEELSLSQQLSQLPKPSERSVLFVFGLDNLSKDSRDIAINALNWGRERLRWAGYSVVLWVKLGTPAELGNRAPDFFSWRSDVFEFDLPKNETERQQIFAQLRLLATVDSNLDELQANYCNYVIRKYDKIGFQGFVKGIDTRFCLEEIFVPITLTKIIETPFPVLLENDKLLKIEELQQRYLQQNKQEVFLQDALKCKQIFLLGDPGAGKSTLLRYLAVILATNKTNQLNELGFDKPLLPILVSLPILVNDWDSSQNLEDLLVSYFIKQGLPDLSKLFLNVLENNQVIVLLDAFDEMTYENQKNINDVISSFIKRYPLIHLVVTSRLYALNKELLPTEFALFKVNSLSVAAIDQFAQKWAIAYESINSPNKVEEQAELRTSSLLLALKHPGVQNLATSPMMLTLLALLHGQIGTLPSRRVDIYRLCVETLVATTLPNELASIINKAGLVDMFAYIACLMEEVEGWIITEQTLKVNIEKFLIDYKGIKSDYAKELTNEIASLINHSNLIVLQPSGWSSFIHLNLQEYLAAHYLSKLCSKADRFTKLKNSLHCPHWREVIVLTAACLDGKDSYEFIEQILNAHLKFDDFFDNLAELKQAELNKEKVEKILFSIADLLLAGYCVKEDAFISLSLKSKIQDALSKLWNEMFDIPFQNIVITDSYITRDYIIGSLLGLLVESPFLKGIRSFKISQGTLSVEF